MVEKLRDVAARDHKNYDCFVCCILSHGVSDAVYGVDGVELPYSRLILPFKPNQCRGLTGKPKLFFIQACQGKTYQMGVENVGKFCLHNFFMKLLLYFTIILLHNSDI